MIRSMNQTEFQNLLRSYLAESQIRNPSYSIRAFAKRLGLGFGTVSQVLAGKRSLAPKSIQKTLDKLGVGPVERAKIFKGPKQKLSYEYTELKADQYFVLSEWHYLGILNLIRTKDFISTAQHISERLGISPSIAKQAMDRLERIGLIQFKNGKMIRTQVALKTSDGVQNSALRKSHYQTLDRARLALDEHPYDSHDFTWLTFAFAPNQIEEARQKIRDFENEFANQFSTSKEAKEVYKLAVQLFSVTKPKPNSKSEEKKD